MAKSIEQIQAMITDKADAREVINEIADYLQTNPGGGGTYTADNGLTPSTPNNFQLGGDIIEDIFLRIADGKSFSLAYENGYFVYGKGSGTKTIYEINLASYTGGQTLVTQQAGNNSASYLMDINSETGELASVDIEAGTAQGTFTELTAVGAAANNINGSSLKVEPDKITITAGDGIMVVPGLVNYANDAAAAIGGIPVNGLYHTSGTLKIRLS